MLILYYYKLWMPGACPNSTVHCTHTLYTYIFNPNCTKILSSRVPSRKGGENSESERDTPDAACILLTVEVSSKK